MPRGLTGKLGLQGLMVILVMQGLQVVKVPQGLLDRQGLRAYQGMQD